MNKPRKDFDASGTSLGIWFGEELDGSCKFSSSSFFVLLLDPFRFRFHGRTSQFALGSIVNRSVGDASGIGWSRVESDWRTRIGGLADAEIGPYVFPAFRSRPIGFPPDADVDHWHYIVACEPQQGQLEGAPAISMGRASEAACIPMLQTPEHNFKARAQQGGPIFWISFFTPRLGPRPSYSQRKPSAFNTIHHSRQRGMLYGDSFQIVGIQHSEPTIVDAHKNGG
ncbi:hypothetical protein B0H17DRAFT_1125645 [Mycena rosella]|uniref:Uncharacterized protein n=1 Tax=Mycena rosella TaxID=1033263 RepID=A0AAD7GWL5_MYCRO|nr:hypothetical protein B0H17DRAFT_1125645 [Mycena rosella]